MPQLGKGLIVLSGEAKNSAEIPIRPERKGVKFPSQPAYRYGFIHPPDGEAAAAPWHRAALRVWKAGAIVADRALA